MTTTAVTFLLLLISVPVTKTSSVNRQKPYGSKLINEVQKRDMKRILRSPSPDVCAYKGVHYRQGQTWRDGCDRICTCVDAKIGKYECWARCSSFPEVPPHCRFVTDPSDSCCEVPTCDSEDGDKTVESLFL